MRKRHLVLLFGLWATTFATTGARAAIGETADSISVDREAMAATLRGTVAHEAFSVHEYASDAVTVREYVSRSGVVFAVAWNGLVHPDLGRLLGSYAGEYREALRRSPRGPSRAGRQVTTEHLIVETWGHMRDLRGRAYAPALVPSGVTISDIT